MNDKYRNAPYIAFCEGDDYWTSPYKLQKQVDFLDKEPQYSMCFHSAEKKYECDGVSWINCENIEDKDYNATEIFVTVPSCSITFFPKIQYGFFVVFFAFFWFSFSLSAACFLRFVFLYVFFLFRLSFFRG